MITFMRSTNVVTADSSNSKPVGWSLIATNVLVSTFHYVCKGWWGLEKKSIIWIVRSIYKKKVKKKIDNLGGW
jgi:hypothetical protein